MSRDDWGRRPRKPKQKRDSWAKPKRHRRKKEFGAVPKKDKKKVDRNWGKPEGKARKGILSKLGDGGAGGWLRRFFKPVRGVRLREYYAKLDKLQASEIQAGVREQLAQYYEGRIERAESLSDKLTRFVEQITRRRLSSGQMDEVRKIAKEVISPQRIVAFATNLFKRGA